MEKNIFYCQQQWCVWAHYRHGFLLFYAPLRAAVRAAFVLFANDDPMVLELPWLFLLPGTSKRSNQLWLGKKKSKKIPPPPPPKEAYQKLQQMA